jgi:octaprenyl-diphosphate synthase
VHLLYGNDTAINSGTFLYLLPLACLSNSAFSEEQKNHIHALWAVYLRRLHLGQAMDIAWHRDFNSLPKFAEYKKMCSLKTGCLARMAAVLGVYCAGYSTNSLDRDMMNNLAEKLGQGAEKLGVGFQILDDVKNLSSGIPGKKRGDDIVEGKKSLPILLYLHRYPEKRDFAASCFKAARTTGTDAAELEELIKALETSGVLEEAQNKGMEFIRESRTIFIETVPLESRELLGGLIDFIS